MQMLQLVELDIFDLLLHRVEEIQQLSTQLDLPVRWISAAKILHIVGQPIKVDSEGIVHVKGEFG
jgi:hypothetical protein